MATKYSKKAQDEVKREMHRFKKGTAKSGSGGKAGKVKSREQAIAIGLSKARKKGAKVSKKPTGTAVGKKTSAKKVSKKTTSKKVGSKKTSVKKPSSRKKISKK